MHGIFDKAEVSGFREYFEGTVSRQPVVLGDPPYIPVWMRTNDAAEAKSEPPQPAQPPAVAAAPAPSAAPEKEPSRPVAEERGAEPAGPADRPPPPGRRWLYLGIGVLAAAAIATAWKFRRT
jgi:hypothetical protein